MEIVRKEKIIDLVILAIKFVVFGINRFYLLRKKIDNDILFSLNIIEKKYFVKICLYDWFLFFRFFFRGFRVIR